MKSALSLVVALALAVGTGGCAKEPAIPTFETVTLPQLKSGQTVTLSVAHVVNPRLPRFSDAQITSLLAAAKATIRDQFSLDVNFSVVETIDITRFFADIPKDAMRWRRPYVYDFKSGKGERTALAHAYRTSVTDQLKTIAEWAPYAAREIGLNPVDHDTEAWVKRLTDTHLNRLAAHARIKAADGAAVIDKSDLNEWLLWDTIGERERAFDFVITNQLVASAEYTTADIHSALRGGISLGTTAYSHRATLGAQSWWSTFTFTSADPSVVALRGGETYTAEEAAILAGTLASHELGHLLFHFGHPFGLAACVMSPTPMLRFRETVSQLNARACREANHAAMKPGAVKVNRPMKTS